MGNLSLNEGFTPQWRVYYFTKFTTFYCGAGHWGMPNNLYVYEQELRTGAEELVIISHRPRLVVGQCELIAGIRTRYFTARQTDQVDDTWPTTPTARADC